MINVGKASIIRAIQEIDKDYHVFMCGDGGNDVGALKQVIIQYILHLISYYTVHITTHIIMMITNIISEAYILICMYI